MWTDGTVPCGRATGDAVDAHSFVRSSCALVGPKRLSCPRIVPTVSQEQPCGAFGIFRLLRKRKKRGTLLPHNSLLFFELSLELAPAFARSGISLAWRVRCLLRPSRLWKQRLVFQQRILPERRGAKQSKAKARASFVASLYSLVISSFRRLWE